ncbi:unnamed protein product [Thlaspi arvense]|uniref:TF-B3 domain-containing protein n=1 Tax=Thlaspi arvense TaxID=13288 RepID=A0AAU9SA30_THLAR|nr:unnamed protein product [Thlaspi arvense]
MYMRGWRSFCHANGLEAGESDSKETSIQDEKNVKKRRISMWKASSSSSSQNRFVTLTLKPFNLMKSVLVRFITTPICLFTFYRVLESFFFQSLLQFLPIRFTRMHGINEETKMTLLNKNGVKWSTDLRYEKSGDRIRLVGGWKEFFKAKCVKVGESVMFKLIWEGDTSCFLKFCCKVKQET